uniref:Uncharacterized protein n=1 Tax=Arundo donax TaxID=35708 RepID=A0A0A9E4M4_ARUDO
MGRNARKEPPFSFVHSYSHRTTRSMRGDGTEPSKNQELKHRGTPSPWHGFDLAAVVATASVGSE